MLPDAAAAVSGEVCALGTLNNRIAYRLPFLDWSAIFSALCFSGRLSPLKLSTLHFTAMEFEPLWLLASRSLASPRRRRPGSFGDTVGGYQKQIVVSGVPPLDRVARQKTSEQGTARDIGVSEHRYRSRCLSATASTPVHRRATAVLGRIHAAGDGDLRARKSQSGGKRER